MIKLNHYINTSYNLLTAVFNVLLKNFRIMGILRNWSYCIVFLCFSYFLSSCRAGKHVAYFQDVPDTIGYAKELTKTQYTEPQIQPNDILQVSIQTIDAQSTSALSHSAAVASEASTNNIPGYLVDKEGYIEMPLVGRVQVAGMTTSEARNAIREKAHKFYVEPVVNVKYANFTITVLGDVSQPGKKVINNEKVSIIDAIGLAGDLSPTGRRENVMLIHEEGGKQVFVRFNLNSSTIFQSPYFYLHPGDIVYVEPNKAKSRTVTTDTSKDRYITLTASLLSIAIAMLSILRN